MNKEAKTLTTFESIGRIINALPKMVSLILGGTALAYVVGWIYAKAYLGVFGANWLLTELSPISLLGNSCAPIALLLFFCYTATIDLEEGAKTERWMIAVVNYGRVLIISFMVVSFTVYVLKLKTVFMLISITFAFAMFLYAAACFGLLVVALRDPKHKWNLLSTYLAFGILMGGFYMAPTNLGLARGNSNINPSTSKLPIVQLKDSKKEYRLLHHNNDTYYIFSLDKKKIFPDILLIDKREIKAIKRFKKDT